MRILFIGDVVGEPGRRVLKAQVSRLVDTWKADVVVVNGENAAGGFGITRTVFSQLLDAGAHLVTSGNHIWDKKEVVDWIDSEPLLIRPANYPEGVPGAGTAVVDTADGERLAVINLSGRVFMPALDCPFRTFDREFERLRAAAPVVLVDFHAEATSEKIAFGHYVAGRASAVIGTHTHVQTADEQILSGCTAYISDVGMTGPADSVIGISKQQIIERFLTGMPRRFDIAKGPVRLMGVLVDVDSRNGKAVGIERITVDHGT